MRPLQVEMHGFGAFRSPTVVDFGDTDFFALVGPTGSGKSTVIDAICFALYGSVPRYDDKRLVGSAMSVGHAETKVRLTFEVGGERYAAFRWVRRSKDGKVTTKEARLEGPDGVSLVDKARDLDARIEALLGLPFDHFTRCVVLPQGAFSRFLHDKPADRQALLVELLDLGVYDRMAIAANRRAAEAARDAEVALRTLDSLAAATPEALADAEAAAVTAAAQLAELALLAPKLAAADQHVAAVGAAGVLAREQLGALRAVAVADDVRRLGDELDMASAALADAEAAHVAASARRAGAASALAAQPPLVPLRLALDTHAQLAEAGAEHGRAFDEEAAARAVLDEAEADLASRRAAAAAAMAQVEAARTASAAHAVREHLHAGEPCPVCLQPVVAVPDVPAPAAWQTARDAATEADQALDAARVRAEAAGRAQASATQRVVGLAKRIAVLSAAVADHREVEVLFATIAAVEAAVADEAEAVQAEHTAATRHETRRRSRDSAAAAVAGLAGRYHAQRDTVAALGAPAPGADLVAAWDELASWAAALAPVHQAEVARLDATLAGAQAARTDVVAAIGEVAVAAGEPRVAPLDELRSALARRAAEAAARAGELARRLEWAASHRAEADAAQTRYDVAHQLGVLLSANGFEKWLVVEVLDALVRGASGTLRNLSGGQYSLAADDSGDFVVVDHANGDERRPVRTLSGGETFQASLALALALSDHLGALAAGGPGKLEALFLDEGFGTLDAESLETVAATIESLGASGRMVGIVTHVRELAERVPVRYEVQRGAITSTVTRVVG